MSGLIFVGMVGPESHNKEERRFVEQLSEAFETTQYLRGAGIKSLRLHQLISIANRLASGRRRSPYARLIFGSLYIIPFRRFARGVNLRLLHHQLAKILKTARGEWTLWIRFPSPELVDAVTVMPGIRIIYEPIDLYSAAEDLSPAESVALLVAESKLIRFATVVTGGRLLAERFGGAAGGSHWLPFGSDQQQSSGRSGILPTNRPRIALVGCLDWRVDEALLVSLMSEHPEWHLVLAGPRVRPWGRLLERSPNVHWLGRIPVERVRPIVRDCDVALVPYRLTEWTRHCLPVKVFEYLAEGKPVVATPLPELSLLGDAVTIAPGAGFAEAIESALDSDSPLARERRRQAADRFTLQDRARRAVELIQGKKLQEAAH